MKYRIFKRSAAWLGGFLAAGGMSLAQAQITTNLISETTFDAAAPSAWGYGYFYGDSALGYQYHTREHYEPEDWEMTNAMWRLSFDLTALQGMTGYGVGGGGPLFRADTDPALLVSTNRENYIISFDARVEDLAEGQTSANGEMQVQFYYQNENEEEAKSLQVNLPFQPTEEWQRFTFDLSEGTLGDNTTEEEFVARLAETTDIRFNVNFHDPHNAFGYDGWTPENVFLLDNVQLEVVDKPAETPLPTFGVPMAEWNFDDQVADYEYHYGWSQNEVQPIVTAGNNAGGNDPNTLGTDESSGWFLTIDSTDFTWNPPQWAGAGTGGAGAVDYSLFDSPELDSYRVTFDARVSGLAADTESSAGVLQLFLDTPDDTLAPADENTDADNIIRVDFPISRATPEWQTYSYVFSKGNVGGGSEENFNSLHGLISGLRTQWQIENASSITDWGYDMDNTLVIDNFKLERLYTGIAEINATRSGDEVALTWSGPETVTLQEAATVEGPYADVAGATSGYTTQMTGEARFFRLVQDEPSE